MPAVIDADVPAVHGPLSNAVGKLLSRKPEQAEAARAALLALARPARPLPEGKTLNDVVEGTWPGDESDAEIHSILNELS
jgi:hypothetical protein